MKLPDEIYVVVCEHDGFKDGQSIVLETSLDEISCTKDAALRRANATEGFYGETRIARLIFDENDHLIERLELGKEYEKHEIGAFDTWF